MPELTRDPELDSLVRELNEATPAGELGGVSAEPTPQPSRPRRRRTAVVGDEPLRDLLSRVVERKGSDLLLVPGALPMMRLDGRLIALGGERVQAAWLGDAFGPLLDDRLAGALDEAGFADFSLNIAPSGARFRVNLHRQRGALAASCRALPSTIPTLAQLNLPPTWGELVQKTRGLVLVCGPAGSGKSSTLAALLGEINTSRPCHVLTIEDPVEFEHRGERALIEQIEIGTDTPSFALALKAALRQAPDVLLVGEMRDLETISMALTAAETGHLVLSTLHTHDAAQAIHRLIDVFPASQQGQIRQQLALSLSAIICQQLVPRSDRPGRVPVVELLLATYAVRHHIRQDAMQKLHHEITLGKRLGMTSLEESLARLVKAGVIQREEAEMRATRSEELLSLLREGTP